MAANGRPLTEAQAGLWYSQALDPANPIFNTGQYIDLAGPLDLKAFHAAVAQASREAEALSLRFGTSADGEPEQALGEPPDLAVVDCTDRSDPAEAARAAIARSLATPVDLARGPIAFQTLYRLSPTRHFWAQQVHHLANDGYGMVMLTKRVAELYAALAEGRADTGRPFAPLDAVLAEDAAYRDSEERARDRRWWLDRFADFDEIAVMKPGRAVSAHRFLRTEQPMSENARQSVAALAKDSATSWPDTLTALVAAYCDRFVADGETVIGMPHMARFGTAAARVPSTVMNVLPLRVTPEEDAPLAEWLASIAGQMREVRGHGRYRSEHLRRDLGLIGAERRLYGALINVQPYDRPPRFAGLEAVLHVTGTGPVEDISFTFRGDLKDGPAIEVEANPDLWDQRAIADHAERLDAFLASAGAAERLADIPTALPREQERELHAFNTTAHPVPEMTLTDLITQSFAAYPEAEAVRFGDEALTYFELDRRSAALAALLASKGAGAERIVAVALPRSLELVVALVAILRAGAAYLPLDPDHPPARIATILAGADPVAVLAPDDPHGLYEDRLLAPGDWPADSAQPEPDTPAPDNAAYVIYTSGSTGEPKGVVVTHRAIVNRLLWMAGHYGITGDDRILQKTPASFDVSVWEFFLPLIRGATLVVAPPEAHRDPSAIARLIAAHRVTTLHFVPSMLEAFLDTPESEGLSIRRVFCSGEALAPDLRDRFHRRMNAELNNLYGPTEAAVDVSYWNAGPDDTSRPVPIGWPVWNTRLLVLDERMRVVPPGTTGHLHLGGVQLARGYLGKPDLTAERFVADPFVPGERLYRTGDLARRREDGAVEFLGRADSQVKIRGLRIELGEIEASIAATGLVRSAVAMVRDERIVAYVVSPDRSAGEALRDALAGSLPSYMVPAAFVVLDALPTTVNGKLDRKALPAPAFAGDGGEAPRTPGERRLAALFAEILDLETQVGRTDDFFALGGDSLSAVRLLLRLREEWDGDPDLGLVFEHPDVAGLATRLENASDLRDEGLAPVIHLARGESGAAPLFLVHPAGGVGWGYRTLARSLAPARAVHAIQAPGLDPEIEMPESIAALARDYADRIDAAYPTGPVHVGGWSVGGLIAQELAVELESRGRAVGMVALLDAYPAECWRAEPEPTEAQALRALLAIAGHDPEAHPELDTREKVVGFLREGESVLANLSRATQDGVVRTVLDTNRLVRGHHHRAFGGTLTHIRADADHADRPQLRADLWAPHCAVLDAVGVPFLHRELPGKPASALIAPILSERMAAAERISA